MSARFIIGLSILILSVAGPLRAAGIVWRDGHHSELDGREMVARYVLSKTLPTYPYEARRSRITGSGVYELRIAKTGETTGIVIVKNSGHWLLDQAAMTAFIKWRFKPGEFLRVRIPVTWTMTRPPF